MNVQMVGATADNLHPGARNKVRQQGCTIEAYRVVCITEDAQYTIYYRGLFNANELYFRKTGETGEMIPISTEMENEYGIDIVEGKILITTNEDAPRKMVYVTDVDQPERENWKVFLPEHDKDKLSNI